MNPAADSASNNGLPTDADPKTAEKRQNPRYQVNRPAYLVRGESPLKVRAVDISIGGAAVISPELLAPGTTCVLRIAFWFGHEPTLFEAQCSVVHSSIVGMDGHRIGMRFTSVSKSSQQTLQRFFDRRH